MAAVVQGRGRRVARRAGFVLLGLVGSVLLLVVAAFGFLWTPWGSDLVRRKALPKVNALLAGQVEAARFRFGGNRIVLEGVTVRDPEGVVAAAVRRVELRFSPLALFGRRLDLSSVQIEAPRLSLVQDRRGLNLARAFEAREKKPAAKAPPTTKEAEPGRLLVRLGELRLTDGVVDFRSALAAPGAPLRHVRFEALDVRAEGTYDAAARRLEAALGLGARGVAPYAAPLSVKVDARAAGETGRARLDLDFGGSAVALTADMAAAEQVVARLERLRVRPALARALVPAYPLVADVEAKGEVTRKGPQATGDLRFDVGAGTIRARGGFDLERFRSQGIEVRGEKIDLAAFWEDGPRSAIAFVLEARGGGRDLKSLEGQARFEVPPSRLDGRTLGPIRLHAEADRGRYKVVDLRAVLPGLELTGAGTADDARLSFDGRLVAKDLGTTVRSFDGPGPGRLPRVEGSGALRLGLSGPVSEPALTVDGRFPRLRFEANELRALSLSARVGSVKRPWPADARVQVASARLGGGRELRGLSLVVTGGAGRAVGVDARIASPHPLRLEAAGRWAADFRALGLERLGLAYPEARWALARPARIAFPDGSLEVDGLALASGAQKLAVDLKKTARRISADVAIARFDLGKLPRALVDPALGLGGLVDARVSARGPVARPEVEARVSLERGRVRTYRDLAATVEARHRAGRVEGTADASALGAGLRARFALPAAWPPPRRSPVTLDLALRDLDLAGAARAAGRPDPDALRGRATATVRLGGTGGAPELAVNAQLRGLAVRKQPVGDVTFDVEGRPQKPLEARLVIAAFGRRSEAKVVAPLDLARLAQRPPTEEELLRLPIEAKVLLDRLPVAALAELAGRKDKVGGTVSLKVDARGTARRPDATVRLELDDAAATNLPPTDALLEARLGDGPRGVETRLRVTRDRKEIASLDAAVLAPIARLFDGPEAIASTPMRVRAHLGPVQLQRIGVPADPEREPPRILRGRVDADLRFEGSARDPRLTVAARADQLQLSGVALGHADLGFAYRDRRPQVDLVLSSQNGGKLAVKGSAEADLSYGGLTRGLDPARVPVDVALRAERFDVGFLSGVTDLVRALEGQLDATGQLRGPLGTPHLQGRVEWTKGRALVAGFGEYRNVHLLVRGDEREMVLEDLSTRSGSGSARLTARATRTGTAPAFLLRANAKLDKFPIYSQGQAMATVSVETKVDGKASPELVELLAKLDEADVTLADGKRKKLQPLKRPADVVIFENGKPLNRAQAKKHQALVAALATEEAAAKGAPAPRRAATPPRTIRVKIDAPRNLWVRGPDAYIELGLGPNFVVTVVDEPRVFGTVDVRRGQLEVLGRKFVLDEDSEVRFTGPPDRPTLAIKAVHEAEKAEMTVVVNATGPTDRLQLALTSPEHPEYGSTELMTVLATGRRPDQPATASSSPESKAASFVGGFVSDRVQKVLSKRLPIDVINIDPGDGLTGARLEAGTYVGDDLYVAYVGNLGADQFRRENRNEVHLEYQITRRWSFEATYGDARRGAADLVWTRHF